MSFYVQGFNNSYEGLFENSTSTSTWLRFLPSSQSNNLQGYDDENYFGFIPQQISLLRDGEIRKVTFIREQGKLYAQINEGEKIYSRPATAAWTFDRLCKFSSTYFGGLFYDFEVEIAGEVVLQLPLTNKEQGAVQLPTVGDITATMANYTPLVWEREGTEAIHYAYTDGGTQYWFFETPIIIKRHDVVRFKTILNIGSLDISYILQSDLDIPIPITMFFNNETGKLTSTYLLNPIVNGLDPEEIPIYIEDGGVYDFQLNVSEDTEISKFFENRGRYTRGCIFDLEIIRDGETILFIPLTNRSQGATQKPTVGDITATMANFTPLIWKNQEEL